MRWQCDSSQHAGIEATVPAGFHPQGWASLRLLPRALEPLRVFLIGSWFPDTCPGRVKGGSWPCFILGSSATQKTRFSGTSVSPGSDMANDTFKPVSPLPHWCFSRHKSRARRTSLSPRLLVTFQFFVLNGLGFSSEWATEGRWCCW